MQPAVRSRLEALRAALAEVNPYPWTSVEAWRARALPLFRESLPKHTEDFEKVTRAPGWLVLGRVASGGNQWGEGRSNNFAEASARETEVNTKRAAEGRDRVLAWLDGILDQAGVDAPEKLSERSKQDFGRDKIFVVHGRDPKIRGAVGEFLRGLNKDPLVLADLPSGGRTVIEKFEHYADDAAYAVVLLTPDDFGGLKSEPDPQSRARQNVIFELGYFMGRLGREHVCLMSTPEVEFPSDLAGVVYVPIDNENQWGWRLVHEFLHAEISLDVADVARSCERLFSGR